MNRFVTTALAAAALASSTAFAADAAAPFEQTQFDRTLPNVATKAPSADRRSGLARSDWGKDRVPDPYNP